MASIVSAGTTSGTALNMSGDTSGVLQLASNGSTTAVTIDTSQNVGIGTSSPGRTLDIRNVTDYQIRAGYSGSSAYYDFGRNGSTGYFNFYGSQSGYTGYVFSGVDGERMRIDSSGNLLVGTTTSSIYNQNTVNGISAGTATSVNAIQIATDPAGATGNACLLLNMRNTPINGAKYLRTFYNGTTETGSISLNGTTGVLYNITSDYRLKNNPVALTNAKDFVMALQPKTWDWWDNSGKGVGFIAHEFMEVAKYSGHGEKDAMDEDGKPVYQTIQPSSSEVIANMVALMQEQQTTINALTARVVALESKVGV